MAASARKVVIKGCSRARRYAFTVKSSRSAGSSPGFDVTAKGTKATLKVQVPTAGPVLTGKLSGADQGLTGRMLKVLVEEDGQVGQGRQGDDRIDGKYTCQVAGHVDADSSGCGSSGALAADGQRVAQRRL